MFLSPAYATPEELEEKLGRADDGTYSMLLDAASRQVEAYCGRQFNRTLVATQRRFRALDPERLPVDDFHTLTDLAVEIDGTAWDAANYDARPWNGVVNGEPGWPFFDLLAVNRSWPIARRATIYVTAQWGWSSVPAGIVEATLDVAQMMASSAAGSSGIVSRESIDNYSVSYARFGFSDLMSRAAPYRRKRFGVA